MAIPRNQKLNQNNYTIPILESIYELTEGSIGTATIFGTIEKPQSAKVEHINRRIFPKIKKLLTEIDYQPVSNDERRWENTARWEKDRLLDSGLIEQVGHGRYKLTPAGMEKLKRHWRH